MPVLRPLFFHASCHVSCLMSIFTRTVSHGRCLHWLYGHPIEIAISTKALAGMAAVALALAVTKVFLSLRSANPGERGDQAVALTVATAVDAYSETA